MIDRPPLRIGDRASADARMLANRSASAATAAARNCTPSSTAATALCSPRRPARSSTAGPGRLPRLVAGDPRGARGRHRGRRHQRARVPRRQGMAVAAHVRAGRGDPRRRFHTVPHRTGSRACGPRQHPRPVAAVRVAAHGSGTLGRPPSGVPASDQTNAGTARLHRPGTRPSARTGAVGVRRRRRRRRASRRPRRPASRAVDREPGRGALLVGALRMAGADGRPARRSAALRGAA